MTAFRTINRSIASISLILATTIMAHATSLQEAVDENFASLEAAIEEAGLVSIASIDHARLAAAEGVEMPPSRVQIFSDPEINSPILKENIVHSDREQLKERGRTEEDPFFQVVPPGPQQQLLLSV